MQRLRCSGRGFRIRLTLKGTIALQAKPIKSPIRPAQRGSPQNGPSAGRSAEAVWVLWETTGGLRLPLQPTTSDSGALLTFAHYNLPFRVSNKGPSSALVAIWGRRNGARAARDVRLQPNTSIPPPMFNFEHCPYFPERVSTVPGTGRWPVLTPCGPIWISQRARLILAVV